MPSADAIIDITDGLKILLQEYQRLSDKCYTPEKSSPDEHPANQQAFLHDGTESKDHPVNNLRVETSSESWWAKQVPGIPAARLDSIRKAIRALAAQDTDANNTLSVGGRLDGTRSISTAPAAAPMPSITESPLELDFTTPGTPSNLDCPFNSLSKRRLSPHAASVVARYKPNGTRTPRSSVSRVDGRASSTARSAGFSDTNQDGGICGALEAPRKLEAANGVCPIRFLDKKTPEEIAEYFEQHKHEVPRSHEVCVKRYQGDSKSLQELDAKYGNLVSMIKGLGAKHAPLLPGRVSGEWDGESNDRETDERVRKWSQTIDAGETPDQSAEDASHQTDRQPRFDRPLKDVRVGESPSRPWGIHVPTVAEQGVQTNPQSPTLNDTTLADAVVQTQTGNGDTAKGLPKCPFSTGANAALPLDHPPVPGAHQARPDAKQTSFGKQSRWSRPVFIAAQDAHASREGLELIDRLPTSVQGPVFVGYSPSEALVILNGLPSVDDT